jgi:phage anti-repressor protein
MNIPTKYQNNPFNNAIEIFHGDRNDQEGEFCEARDLHGALGVGRDFSNWFKDRIEKYGFEQGADFSPILAKSLGGRPATNYLITLDMAKELSMIENNEIGRKIRRYFIEAEKAARAMLIEQANQVQPIEQVTNRIKDNGKFKYLIILHEQGHKLAKAMVQETDSEAKYQLHCQLRQMNDALGIPTPPLNNTRSPQSLQHNEI